MAIDKKQPVISAQTLIPLGLIGAIIASVVWLTTIYNTGQTNSADIVNLRSDVVSLQNQFTNVLDRMGRIETKLDFIIEQLKAE